MARTAARTSAGPTPATARERTQARKILDIIERTYPDAKCALDYRDPFQLIVATILSAQCTDERVNKVTPELFRRFPTAQSMAQARQEDLEALIRSTGFFRTKSKSLLGCARALMEAHGGEVPRTMDALVRLPGVGRKTANVVLGHAFDIAEGIAVDTHVQRVANRLGLVHTPDPVLIERRLMRLIPLDRWTLTTDLLIFHGRRICEARRPLCGSCPVYALCRWEHRQAYALGGRPLTVRPRRG